MSSRSPASAPGPPASAAVAPVDAEISVRGIGGFAVALALVIAVSIALMWGLASWLRAEIAAADPPPPVLPEARATFQPPEPRLQRDPERDLVSLRAEEARLLEGYAWLDETGGVARIPIHRAVALMAAAATAPPAAPPAAAGAEEGR